MSTFLSDYNQGLHWWYMFRFARVRESCL